MSKSKDSPKISPVDIVGFYQPGGAVKGKALDRIINYSEDDLSGKSITNDSEDNSLDKEATGLLSIHSGSIDGHISNRPNEVWTEEDEHVANTFFGKEDDINLTDSFPISQEDVIQDRSNNKTINNEIKNETKLFPIKNKQRELNSYSKIGEIMSKENFEILKLSEALSRRGHKLASDNVISLIKQADESEAVNLIANKVFGIWNSGDHMIALSNDEKAGLRTFIQKVLQAPTNLDPLELMGKWSDDFGDRNSFTIFYRKWDEDLLTARKVSEEMKNEIRILTDDQVTDHKSARSYAFKIPYTSQRITMFGTDEFANEGNYHQGNFGDHQTAEDWKEFLSNIKIYADSTEYKRILGQARRGLAQETGEVGSGFMVLNYNVPSRVVTADGSLSRPTLAILSEHLLGNANYYVNSQLPGGTGGIKNVNMALEAGVWIKIHYKPSLVTTATWQKLRVFDKALGTSAVRGLNYFVIPKDQHNKFKRSEYKGKKIELVLVDADNSGNDSSLQVFKGSRYLARVDGTPVHNPVLVSGGNNASDGVTASDHLSDLIKVALVCPTGSKASGGKCYKVNGDDEWVDANNNVVTNPTEEIDAGPSTLDLTQTQSGDNDNTVPQTQVPETQTQTPPGDTQNNPTPRVTRSRWENTEDGGMRVKEYIKSGDDAENFRKWVRKDPDRLAKANRAIASFKKQNGSGLATPHVLSQSKARNNYLSAAWTVLGAEYYSAVISPRVNAPESGSQAMTDISNEDLRAYITMKSVRAKNLPPLTDGGESGLAGFMKRVKGLQNEGPDAFSYDNPNGLGSSDPVVAARAAENLDIVFEITYYVDELKKAFEADAAKVGPDFMAQLKMEKAQAQRAEERAKKNAEKERKKREQGETQAKLNPTNFFISTADRDEADKLPPLGAIFVAKQSGEIYYIGQQEVTNQEGQRVKRKALYELEDRARGLGGVDETRAYLTSDEKEALYKEMTIGEKEFWQGVFDAQENFIDSLDNWDGWDWLRAEEHEREGALRIWKERKQQAVERWLKKQGPIGQVTTEATIPLGSNSPTSITSGDGRVQSGTTTRTTPGQDRPE